jgi:hypothetical protein
LALPDNSFLLHQRPSTLKFIQFELDCSHFLCRLGVSSLGRPQQHLTTLAHQHDPEPAFHPAGELGGVSLDLGRQGGMQRKYGYGQNESNPMHPLSVLDLERRAPPFGTGRNASFSAEVRGATSS